MANQKDNVEKKWVNWLLFFLGITLSAGFIWFGIKYETSINPDSETNTIMTREVNEKGEIKEKLCSRQNLNRSLIELQIAVKNKISELGDLKEKLSELGTKAKKDGESNPLQEDYAKILEEVEKKTVIDMEIEERINDINEYVVFQKKIIMANIFFTHIIKLIFIFSGIVGLFSILIIVSKEKPDNHGRQ